MLWRLGGPYLARAATSLRTRWLWRIRTDPLRPWPGLDMHFSWMEIQVFDASTTMVVGDGATTLFWVDRWLDGKTIGEIASIILALIPKSVRNRCTIREALVARRWIFDIALALWEYVQLWRRLCDFNLSTILDTLLWRWMMDA